MEEKNSREQDITKEDLTSLGQYVIKALEHPDNEIDIKSDILNSLKKEVTLTKRFMGDISQDDAELKKIVSYFNRQKEIVDEVILTPHLKQDIEFTTKFVASNQKRINVILKIS